MNAARDPSGNAALKALAMAGGRRRSRGGRLVGGVMRGPFVAGACPPVGSVRQVLLQYAAVAGGLLLDDRDGARRVWRAP